MYENSKEFYEPYDLLFYHSPTIPYDFPKQRLPQSLCELELLKLMKCFREAPNHRDEVERATLCQPYTQEIYHCKRRRDLNIWANIKEWETERVTAMTAPVKRLYANALREELKELNDEFEQVPASEDNRSKRWKLSSDIMQTEWRLGYVEKLVS